ncbi:MAG: serpin family protein [Clostridiales bacterium]|nr:serpin family protein [Clostridiales bacterium]
MNRKIRTIAAVMAVTMLLGACGSPARHTRRHDDDPDDIAPTVTGKDREEKQTDGIDFSAVQDASYDEETVDAYMQFAISLYANCVSEGEEDQNVMISPASVLMAMGMVSAGASGNNLDEIISTLAPGADPYELHAFAGDYNRRLNSADDSIRSVNSIWINENRSEGIYQDFLDYVTGTYDAEIRNIAFDPSGVDMINSWVNDNTDGMIPNIISELNNRDLMVLVNAIAFEQAWMIPYTDADITEDHVFHNSDGTDSYVTMLFDTSYMNYYSTDIAKGFARPYEGGDYIFLTMLPADESISANEFVSSLTAEDFTEFWNSATYDRVITMMPEFEADYDIELNNVLQQMGINEAFDDRGAGFGNMTDMEVYISRVIHKTHIELDRGGTRAAAATAVDMATASAEPEDYAPPTVILDRPYAYAIVEASTGLPLFIGTVNTL